MQECALSKTDDPSEESVRVRAGPKRFYSDDFNGQKEIDSIA